MSELHPCNSIDILWIRPSPGSVNIKVYFHLVQQTVHTNYPPIFKRIIYMYTQLNKMVQSLKRKIIAATARKKRSFKKDFKDYFGYCQYKKIAGQLAVW